MYSLTFRVRVMLQ